MQKIQRLAAVLLYDYLSDHLHPADMPAYTPETINGLLYALNRNDYRAHIISFPVMIEAMLTYMQRRFFVQYQHLLRQWLAYKAAQQEQPAEAENDSIF